MMKPSVKVALLGAILLAFVSTASVSAQRCKISFKKAESPYGCKITFKNTGNACAPAVDANCADDSCSATTSRCTIRMRTCAPVKGRLFRRQAVVSYTPSSDCVVFRGRFRLLRRCWQFPISNGAYYYCGSAVGSAGCGDGE